MTHFTLTSYLQLVSRTKHPHRLRFYKLFHFAFERYLNPTLLLMGFCLKLSCWRLSQFALARCLQTFSLIRLYARLIFCKCFQFAFVRYSHPILPILFMLRLSNCKFYSFALAIYSQPTWPMFSPYKQSSILRFSVLSASSIS